MHPQRKQRLILVLLLLLAVSGATALIFLALQENLNLFYPPKDVVAGKAPVGQSIRIGGMVRTGSVQKSSQSLQVHFVITDCEQDVPVVYEGILPDLFSEGDGVVARGKLDESGLFKAEEVLAKHDENYQPPEVMEAMQDAKNISDCGL